MASRDGEVCHSSSGVMIKQIVKEDEAGEGGCGCVKGPQLTI